MKADRRTDQTCGGRSPEGQNKRDKEMNKIRDILLKNVRVNAGCIIFECPVCGADAQVHKQPPKEGENSLYWTLLAIYRHIDPTYYGNSRLSDGSCAACGCKG